LDKITCLFSTVIDYNITISGPKLKQYFLLVHVRRQDDSKFSGSILILRMHIIILGRWTIDKIFAL
jgi:hypothetical protein